MTIAIHQPNYLPWLGYFYKIYASDVFVFHDAVEFSKASYTKRCKIRKEKTSPETTWLSIPVQRHQTGALISEILIEEKNGRALRHLHKITNTYGSARYYDTYYEWLRQILMQAEAQKTLADCNMFLIREIAQRLSLKATFRRSSEMQLSGKGSALNLSIAQHLGATQYLAGVGSSSYEDDNAFLQAGITLIRHDLGAWLDTHPYDQGTGQKTQVQAQVQVQRNQEANELVISPASPASPSRSPLRQSKAGVLRTSDKEGATKFTGGLSVVDALMHVGEEGILELFGRFQTEQQ